MSNIKDMGDKRDPEPTPKPKKVRPDMINHPQHYGGDTPYEAIKVIEAWGLNFNLGNSVRYIRRAGHKGPDKMIEDMEKARWYLDREIQTLKRLVEEENIK